MARMDIDLDRHIDFARVADLLREHPQITSVEWVPKQTDVRRKKQGPTRNMPEAPPADPQTRVHAHARTRQQASHPCLRIGQGPCWGRESRHQASTTCQASTSTTSGCM